MSPIVIRTRDNKRPRQYPNVVNRISVSAVNSYSGAVPSTSLPGNYYERGDYGTSLGSMDYTPNANAKWIDSVNGNDANSGTLGSPWKTLSKALASGQGYQNIWRGVPDGNEFNARIIKEGKVRSEFTNGIAYQVSGNGTQILGAPGEAVMFDGSDTITATWTQDATTGFWWRTFTPPFDWSPQDTTSYWGTSAYATAISTDDWTGLDGKAPGNNPSQDIYWQQVDATSYFGSSAARPDRRWMDGIQLVQVDKLSKLAPGRFFLDAKNNREWFGDNPNGKLIEATVEQKLFTFLGYDQALSNIGIRRYANSMPQGGVVSVNRARFMADHLYMSDYMAGITLVGVNNGIAAYDSVIQNSTFRYGKSIHVRGTKSDRIQFKDNYLLNGNSGLFNPAPASGSIKFTYLRDTDVNHNKFVNAELPEYPTVTGHGKMVWFDAAVWRPTIRNNEMWYTGQRSVVCELTCDATIFNNLDMYPGAESHVLVDAGGNARVWNNTSVGVGRLRGNPETKIKGGFWRGAVIDNLRDTRLRDTTGLTPPDYVYDGRESTPQWAGGNGNEAVAPLEPYPYQGNTPKSLHLQNNVMCRWDQTAAYIDEDQKPTSTGVPWTNTGRVQNYNIYQPSTTLSPPDPDIMGANAGYLYFDDNTANFVQVGTEAGVKNLGLDLNSVFVAASASNIVDSTGKLVNTAYHSQMAVIPDDLIALLPSNVTLPSDKKYAGRIAPTVTTVAPHTAALKSGTNAAPARLSVMGDSITFGAAYYGNSSPKYLYSWLGRERTALSNTYGNGGSGWVLFNQDLYPSRTAPFSSSNSDNQSWEPRMVFTGSNIVKPSLGLYGRGALTIPNGGSTSPTDYVTITETCTEFWLLLVAGAVGSTGVVRFSIDGGASKTAQNTRAAQSVDIARTDIGSSQHIMLKIPAGTLGQHSIKIWGDGGTIIPAAWSAPRYTGKIVLDNLAISGQALGSLYGSTAAGRDGNAYVDSLAGDVVLIALGANDYNGGSPLSTATTRLNNLITRIKSNGKIPLGMFPPQSDNSVLYPGNGAPTYTQYVNAFADTYGAAKVPFLNLQKLWAPNLTDEQAIYDAGKKLGKYADTVHPTDSGAIDIAAAVNTFLGF